MAIIVKQNQALGFNVSDDCKCGGVYCQPYNLSDQVRIQGTVTEITGTNILYNGGFGSSTGWTLDSGYSITGGKLVVTNAGSTAYATSTIPLQLEANRIYRIKAAVTVTSVGSATTGTGWYVKVNDVKMTPQTGTGTNKTQTVVWYYQPSSITTDVVVVGTTDNTIDFEIESIEVSEMSMVGFAFVDENGNEAYSYDSPATLTYYAADDYTGESTSILWIAIISFTDLAGLGCYSLSFYDEALKNANRVRNGTFPTDLTWWTAGTHWSWDSNRALYNPVTASAGTLSQAIVIPGGYIYTLAFTSHLMGLNDTAQVLYQINAGGTSQLFVFTGNGAHSHEIDLTAYSGNVTLTIYFAETTPSQDFAIDNVSIKANDAQYDYESACISIKTSHDCTLLLLAQNNDNAFGFDYSTASGIMRHYVRVKAKLNPAAYPEEVEDYRFSNNERALLYALTEKEYQVVLTDQPEYIHDCIRHMRLHDIFKIDGTEYVRSGEYGFKPRKTSKLAQASFNVKDKTGIANNYSCSS